MLNDQYITELVKKAAEFGNGKIHIIVSILYAQMNLID